MRRVIVIGAAAMIAAALAIQLIPYGHSHSNPVVRAEPSWDSAETRTLVSRACRDCHSNETTWPWYSYVAPVSWAVQRHVSEGRNELNFSEWDRSQEVDEIIEVVRDGSMPPRYYTLMHPEARLTGAEVEALMRGLQATFPAQREGRERERER